jgi:hypothetical protein
VSAEEFNVSDQSEPDRDNDLLRWPGAALVQYVPKPIAHEEPDLPGGA